MELNRKTLREIRDCAHKTAVERHDGIDFFTPFKELAHAADALDAMLARKEAETQSSCKSRKETEFLSVCPLCKASIVVHATAHDLPQPE